LQGQHRLLLLLLIKWAFNSYNSLLSISFFRLQFEHFRVSNQSFFRLFALFIQHTQIVPNFAHLWIQCGSFYNIVKRICEVPIVIVKYGQCDPIDSLTWIFIGCLLEVLQSFFLIFKAHLAPSQNVVSVSLTFILLFGFLHILNCHIDIALEEVRPCKVLINFVVVFIMV